MREVIEDKIKLAPESPGVYIFKGKSKINYIGKAKNLKHRLYQHLQYYDKDPRERSMIDKSIDIEWIVTSNEYEALILEIDLIQTHKPLYNRIHRYGSGYPMILLTEDEYPTVKVVRGTEHKGTLYGPFIYMGRAYKIKKLIHKTFTGMSICFRLKLQRLCCRGNSGIFLKSFILRWRNFQRI